MAPQENLSPDYRRLTGFLRSISLRLQLRSTLEFILLLASAFILVILGGLFIGRLKGPFSYFPFFYSLTAILFLSLVFLSGLWRCFSKPSLEQVARGLEGRFPQLRDDVINSLLLFQEIKKSAAPGQISEGLVKAQIGKTVRELSPIKPWQVVSLRGALRPLGLFLPLALAFFLVLASDPAFFNRSLALIIHPFSTWPLRETFLSLDPRGSIILRGSEMVFTAKATGYAPEKLILEVRPEGGRALHLPMDSEGQGRFRYRMASAQFSFQYQAQAGQSTSPSYHLRVVDPPEVTGVKLTLIPPEYTGLPREIRQDGHIEALKGTVVNLEAQTNKPLREARLVLNEGSPLALGVKEDRLKGSLIVFYPGSYSIRVKDGWGFENPNPVRYRIQLLPDQYPQAEIISPAQDLEVAGSEITPIVYSARDDFGITALRLNYQRGGREGFINLKSAPAGRSWGPETFQWDLTGLALTPGERVVTRLEVWDNDSISGPKVGYSRTLTLFVRDERDRAVKEVEEAQQIADAILDLLADHLEKTMDREELSQRLNQLSEQVDHHLQQVGEDKIQRYDLEALQRNLSSLNKRMEAEPKETVTREL
ncbi:MAG: hypothetical protein HY787_29555, partial [Deltaproteobacteria bacterium]|nr:hypothetical protein [Deltaproteobacteria bacterium]